MSNRTSSTRRQVGIRSLRRTRWVAVIAALCVVATGTLFDAQSRAAYAASYPSYADVLAARNSDAAKKAEVSTLNGLLASLKSDVDSTQADAAKKGLEAQAAQSAFDDATAKAAKYRAQADAARTKADASKQQAGQLAAQLARSGGSDLSERLFFGGSQSKSLLAQLGLATVVKDQSGGLYAKAVQDEKSASSLTDQADVAKDALKTLSDDAQKSLDAAATAATAAASALAAQQAHAVELNAQLALLNSSTAQTEAGYAAGVAAQKAAEAAARATATASLPAGQVTSTGWALPSAGRISSPYGYRIDPYTHVYALHEGTDLAPGCGAPIYAAHSGTVILAGPYGGYGNYVRIRNDGDSSYWTAYGHVVNGGILVHVGEHVTVGQNIALVGSTGNSTGCHLHFEIYHNGTTQDPVPFMASVGVQL